MGKVLSISIFKGGAGKTASSVSLASALGQLGARVLLIDLDQQASATRHIGLDPETETPNLYHVFKKQVTARTAVKTLDHGFSVIPGNSLLAAIEEALEEGDETMLRELIAGLRDEFDSDNARSRKRNISAACTRFAWASHCTWTSDLRSSGNNSRSQSASMAVASDRSVFSSPRCSISRTSAATNNGLLSTTLSRASTPRRP